MKLDFYKSNNLPTTAKEGSIGFDTLSKTIKLKTSSGWDAYSVSDKTLYEGNLKWGGKNFADGFSPLDACLTGIIGANRFAFMPTEKIEIEYSTNSGTTWNTYNVADQIKTMLLLPNVIAKYGVTIGGKSETGVDKSTHQLRISIKTQGSLYAQLNKFIIYLSTTGSTNCWCTIDAQLQKDLEESTDVWKTLANKIPVRGWSGFNVINLDSTIETYGHYKTSQYGVLRFTFGCTTHDTTYGGLTVYSIQGFGGTAWTAPSTLAQTGNLFNVLYNQSAEFPAYVRAQGFAVPNYTNEYVLLAGGGYKKTSELEVKQAETLVWTKFDE